MKTVKFVDKFVDKRNNQEITVALEQIVDSIIDLETVEAGGLLGGYEVAFPGEVINLTELPVVVIERGRKERLEGSIRAFLRKNPKFKGAIIGSYGIQTSMPGDWGSYLVIRYESLGLREVPDDLRLTRAKSREAKFVPIREVESITREETPRDRNETNPPTTTARVPVEIWVLHGGKRIKKPQLFRRNLHKIKNNKVHQ